MNVPDCASPVATNAKADGSKTLRIGLEWFPQSHHRRSGQFIRYKKPANSTRSLHNRSARRGARTLLDSGLVALIARLGGSRGDGRA